MKSTPKCFISYESNDVDGNFLSLLKKSIESKDVKVILDKVSFLLGDNILEKEKRIKSSEAIIVIFSENYKKKIVKGEDSGVFREYSIIKELANNKDKVIIPILYSGTIESSVPEEYKYMRFLDISSIQPKIVVNKKKNEYNNALLGKIKGFVSELKNKLDILMWSKDPTFRNLDEEYNALFVNTNAAPIPRECIILTKAYKCIKDQSAQLILGRKGSGKTTLLETIRRYDSDYLKRYKMTEPINAEHINIGYFYENVIIRFKSCLSEIGLTKILETFWKTFLFLHSVYDIAVEIENNRIIKDDSRYKTFKQAANHIKSKLGQKRRPINTEDCRKSMFYLATELILNHLTSGIFKNANVETLLTSVNANFNADGILSDFFGKKLFADFCKAIKACEKKIFIALDGFDSHSEDFRHTTNNFKYKDVDEYDLRKKFEIYFYRELIILVSNIKDAKVDNFLGQAFSVMDFCIIIPQDRYDEIQKYDRDSVKREYCCLCWDANDLLEMLVLRLEFYFKDYDNVGKSLISRFNLLLKKHLPNIPLEIMVNINEHEMPMHIFNYILRLSFWRPRDILTNFAVILKISKEVNGTDNLIQGIIKKLLTRNSRQIIENEFIKEYKNVYGNLDKVLQIFEKKDLIMDFQLFYELLDDINIESLFTDDRDSSQNKLDLLYKMGVVGLYCDKNEATMHDYGFHICFIFNEGLQPLVDLNKSEKYLTGRTKIIFNLIFAKYLELNINTSELLMNFTECEIEMNHVLSGNIRRI